MSLYRQSENMPTGYSNSGVPFSDPSGYYVDVYDEWDLLRIIRLNWDDANYITQVNPAPTMMTSQTDLGEIPDPDRELLEFIDQMLVHNQPYADTVTENNFFQDTPDEVAALYEREALEWDLARTEGLFNFYLGIAPQGQYSADVCSLMIEIKRHMLETNLEPSVDVDLSLWTTSEVLGYMTLRLQRFLVEAGIIRKLDSISVAASTDYINLAEDVLEIRRVEWEDSTGRMPLTRIDVGQADPAMLGWDTTAGAPIAYIEAPQFELQVQTVPLNLRAGTLHVQYVPLQSDLVLEGCPPLQIPNIFAPAIKWGTIADMLWKEGEANDPVRAQAAESRFQEGIKLAQALIGELS